MFSKAYYEEIRRCFEEQMALLEDRRIQLSEKEAQLPEEDRGLYCLSRKLLEQKIKEIRDTMQQCSQDQEEALCFLYSAMPLSDLLNYPASLYLAYAEHGVFLWKEGSFAGKVPEKIFANYVLHYRVHNEDITDTRRFFYDQLKDRTAGKGMYDAVLEANRWCAEKATYRSTYPRTQNPLTMYHTAAGRCGEEAPFAVTALRSLGIPARDTATPLWAHCDDNHAWVEAWCDGGWHYFGACEPEDRLDSGWFVTATSRAMLITSVWFGKDAPLEPVVEKPDMSSRLNHLALYAETSRLKVRVVDEEGIPVPGAKVEFDLLNYGKFSAIARLYTAGGEDMGGGIDAAGGENAGCGTVEIETGYGDLLVCASKGECYGEALASLTEGRECTVVIREKQPRLNQWREIDLHAPRPKVRDERKTDAQLAAKQAGLDAAARSRKQRVAAFYQEDASDRVLARFEGEEREELQDILRKARGNMGEIVRFLEWDFGSSAAKLQKRYGEEHWKLKALKTLKENDYWDISAEILAQCCACAAPYAEDYPEEIFFSCLLCPCVAFEKASGCREFLRQALGEEQAERIRKDPSQLLDLLDELLISLPKQEYAGLSESPVGCLTGGIGNEFSKKILCVNLYRALGIPARLRPFDRKAEYYKGDEFVPAEPGSKEVGSGSALAGAAGEAFEKSGSAKPENGFGKLILTLEEPLKLGDWMRYSLARFEAGHFTPLALRWLIPEKKQDDSEPENVIELSLERGIYRALTTNRLPNGNQYVRVCDFELQAGETKKLRLSVREISAEDMKERVSVKDFALYQVREEGKELSHGEGTASLEKRMLSDLSRGGRALLVWLELTREPTEHILNEMREKKEAFGNLEAMIYFVVREGGDYKKDPTLSQTLKALPKARLLTDSFEEEYEALSGSVRCNQGVLPFAVVLEDGAPVYADCGYNVGMADILLRILS